MDLRLARLCRSHGCRSGGFAGHHRRHADRRYRRTLRETHVTVRIDNGKIVEIAPTAKATAAQTSIDGTGRYLLPGFFDNNAHLTVYGQPARRDTSAKYGDRNEELALEFAQRTLKAGVTTLIDSLWSLAAFHRRS